MSLLYLFNNTYKTIGQTDTSSTVPPSPLTRMIASTPTCSMLSTLTKILTYGIQGEHLNE